MQIVKDYRDNKVLRDSFNGLAKKAPMDTADDWEKMVKVMKGKAQCGNMTMCGNEDPFMFYLSQFMRECVYYIESSDTYVIAEIEGKAFETIGDDKFMFQAIAHA